MRRTILSLATVLTIASPCFGQYAPRGGPYNGQMDGQGIVPPSSPFGHRPMKTPTYSAYPLNPYNGINIAEVVRQSVLAAERDKQRAAIETQKRAYFRATQTHVENGAVINPNYYSKHPRQ
jgi:hypothetical protein